jgi:hypothetical protein
VNAHRLRHWLLLLLIALMPLRGALASALMCTVPAQQAAMASAPAQPMDEMAMTGHAHHAMADHAKPGAASLAHDKCQQQCAAFCALPSLLNSTPTLEAPGARSGSGFPALAAPAPSFLSGGQDRPPRSC